MKLVVFLLLIVCCHVATAETPEFCQGQTKQLEKKYGEIDTVAKQVTPACKTSADCEVVTLGSCAGKTRVVSKLTVKSSAIEDFHSLEKLEKDKCPNQAAKKFSCPLATAQCGKCIDSKCAPENLAANCTKKK